MRTILVTGCSSGIGEACIAPLLKEGWQVHATVRQESEMAKISEMGAHAHILDYCDKQSIHNTFENVMAISGNRLDALFNNGAYGQPGAVEDLTTDVLRAQFEANFFGWHELTNLCIPVMRAQAHGRIVHCSSILGWVAAPYRGAYNASKFALEGLASTMRLELANENIHVSLIEPGPIATRFSANALEKFLANIDHENSAHKASYENELKRLRRQQSNSMNKFTLPASAVYEKLDHALNAKTPRAHYPVTIPTHFMNVAKRLLPQKWLDQIIIRNT